MNKPLLSVCFFFGCISVSCDKAPKEEPVPVTGITISPISLALTEGESGELTVKVLPADADNQKVYWSCDNPCVSVMNNGKVTAVSPGTATVTVRTDEGGFEAKCSVVSKERIYPVSSVSLNEKNLSLFRGRTATLVATVEPSNATNKKLTWSSSNSDVVRVDDGVILAVDEGTAVVTVESEDGAHKASCDVTVTINVVDLSADGTANSYIVPSAGDYKFKADVKGNSAEAIRGISSASVLWESFGTSESILPGDIVKTATLGEDGYVTLFIAPGAKNGNALVAVKDAGGEVLWSWHIWFCSGYDAVASQQTYSNNAGVMMDRNLGATSATPGSVGALGLMYQWGRKDPFLGADAIQSQTFARSSKSFPAYVKSTETRGTIDYAVKHPMTFITENEYNHEWLYPTDDPELVARWKDEKTVYDPCPPGWRVPGKEIWEVAGVPGPGVDKEKWDRANFGVTLDKTFCQPDAWYPATGIYYSPTGEFFGAGGLSQYLSCSLLSESQNYIYFFDSSGNYGIHQMSMGHASSVRCQKIQ